MTELKKQQVRVRRAGDKVRILHIISTLSPAAGGPPESVRQLVEAYHAIGGEIEVVCLDDPQADFLGQLSCRVHALGQSYLGRYSFSPRLWRWLEENIGRFDGVVVNGIWTFPGVAARLAAMKKGRPYGVFVHGALDPWFNRRYPFKHMKKLMYWPMQHAVLRDARAVFFTSPAERDLALTSFRPSSWNSVVVPYGINDPEEAGMDGNAQVEEFYGKFPSLRNSTFLLFLGRIHEKKGCDMLIDVFAKIAQENPMLELMVAGPDPNGLKAKLQRRAEKRGAAERIHWPGMLNGNLKWGALRACDAFVLPSHQENFGIAVVEALAAGRPVLISDQVNIWDEIQSERAGLVRPDTPEGTEQLLRTWIGLPHAKREEMARRARPTFIRHYSMRRTAQTINNVLDRGVLNTDDIEFLASMHVKG